MANKLLIKKSSVPAKAPTTSDLDFGELAINYADGKLYFKSAANTIESIASSISGAVTSVDGNAGAVTSSQLLTSIKKEDGAGSGLDADLLDGQHGSYYLDWANTTNKPDPVITVTLTGDITGSANTTLTDLASGTVSITTTASSILNANVTTITKTLTLTTDWQDTGISGTDLATGSYLMQLFANDAGAGGTNSNEYYTGSMSWYSGSTTSGGEMPTDEIVLHRAGAGTDGSLYLRTYRSPAGSLKLQVYANQPNVSASNYVFKFKRLI